MDRKKEIRATILTILIPLTERRQHKKYESDLLELLLQKVGITLLIWTIYS